jgi:hypothetical protein
MVGRKALRGILSAILVVLILSGCGSVATKHKFYGPITDDVRNNEYQSAVTKIDLAKADNQYEHKDRLLYYLDAGFANHYADNYDTSIVKLTLAEDAAEELFTRSVSRAAASLALNDNILEYSGEDYEVLYTNLFNALNFLAKDNFDDAFVEIRRSNEKLDLLMIKYAKAAEEYKTQAKDDTLNINSKISYDIDRVRFNNDAFARYLSMHMYAAEGKFDDARIDYDRLVEAFDNQQHIYNFSRPNVKYRASKGVIVSVVALTGLSPIKEAVGLRIRTDKDLGLVQVLYTDGPNKDSEYGHIPFPVTEDYYFKFSLPVLVDQPSRVSRVRVLANGMVVGQLQLIEDVGNVAKETFRAKKSLIYFRSIARAIFKGLAAHKAKKKIDEKHDGLGGWLMKAAVDVGTDIIENADLRCSHLLPGKVYIGDFELEPGAYDVAIEFYGAEGNLLKVQRYPDYQVGTTGWNMLEAFSLN